MNVSEHFAAMQDKLTTHLLPEGIRKLNSHTDLHLLY